MALHLPLPSLESPTVFFRPPSRPLSLPLSRSYLPSSPEPRPSAQCLIRRRRRRPFVGNEDTELRVADAEQQQDPDPEDLEYVQQIKRVLELLKKNRDMTIGEVKLIIMIEDLRDTERKRLLGIEDLDEVNRDSLVAALDEISEGRVPENRVALRLLAEEMNRWPDLETSYITSLTGGLQHSLEAEPSRKKRTKSLYAKTTDTGIDPQVAAKRLNIDWDSAVDIESEDESDDMEVPAAVGYSALYLVTALPVIIGVSVVLILFYNSLQ